VYARCIIFGVALCLFFGCSILRIHYNVEVDSINNPSISSGKLYILFSGVEGVDLNDLQFQEYAAYIHPILARKGYVQAESFDQAEIGISLYYAIGEPEISYSSSTDYDWVGGKTSRFESNTFGSDGYSHTTGEITSDRSLEAVGTSITTIKEYPRYLTLKAFDLKAYKEDNELITIWKTTAESWGSSNDLRYIFPVLAAAVEEYIGSNTGKKISVWLDDSDERLKVVRSSVANDQNIAEIDPTIEDYWECIFNQDYTSALKIIKSLAQKGDAEAQFCLGMMYHEEIGLPHDFEEEAKWVKMSAEQGFPDAECFLGWMYCWGHGVPKDKDTSLEWYMKAAIDGHPRAQYIIGSSYQGGLFSFGLPEKPEESVKWLKKAAEQGFGSAQSSLGHCYLEGYGVEQDKNEAIKWYMKSAEQGNGSSALILGDIFYDDTGAPENYSESTKWYTIAADKGFAIAQYKLGEIYQKGLDGYQDYSKAAIYYNKAANVGHPKAQESLGELYEKGLGVPQDYVLAYMWLCLASAKGDVTAITARDSLSKIMTPDQISEAQKLAGEWKPEDPQTKDD